MKPALKTLLNLSLVLASIFSLPAQAVPQDALGLTPEQLETLKAMARARGEDPNANVSWWYGFSTQRMTAPRLMWALDMREPDFALLLLELGADPNSELPQVHTSALMLASEKGYLDVVEALIKAGADVQAANLSGDTALSLAIQAHKIKMVEYWLKTLKARGLSREAIEKMADGSARKPLFNYLSGEGALDAMAQWFKAGGDINQRDLIGRTPLMAAATNGQQQACEWLLAQGAKVNLLDNTGSSALMYGVRAEHPALVTSLLKAGAQPGFQNHAQGNTALHDAVLLKQPAIVLILLREGANPHLKNWEGQSPLDYAKQRAPDIAKIIEATRL